MKPICSAFFLLSFVLVISTTNSGALAADITIHCPLVWVAHSLGSDPPKHIVPTTTFAATTTQFIARTLAAASDGDAPPSYVIGRYDTGSGRGYFALNSTHGIARDFFDVLTNPHDCLLKWGDEGSTQHLVSGGASGAYVGRATTAATTPFAGQVASGLIRIYSDEATPVHESPSFDLLMAYSKGLTLEMTNFDFGDSELFSTRDILGIDEIHNAAEALVTQKVTHTKTMSQSTTVRSSRKWGHTFKINVNVKMTSTLNVPGLNVTATLSFSQEFVSGDEVKSEFTKTINNTYEVSRVVTVHAFSSVQVCSTIMMAEGVELDYVAEGRYTAPGLGAEEVAAVLAMDGVYGVPDGDAIVVEEEGVLTASAGLSTVFITTDMDDALGCSTLAAAIGEVNRAKSRGLEVEVMKEKWNQVEELIVAMGMVHAGK